MKVTTRYLVAKAIDEAIRRERVASIEDGGRGSIVEVARNVRMPASTLGAYATGDRLPPIDTLVKVCDALEIDKLELFEGLAGCEE